MSRSMPLAVLVSGSGSNLQALLDAAEADPAYGAHVAVVISDRPGVGALARAADAGVPTEVVEWSTYADRAGFTAAVCDRAGDHGAEALILAGFMRVLDAVAMERFPDAILNVHPALLPAFPGTRAVEQALTYGVTVTGVTIHFVDEEVDHGPIVAQEAVPVHSGDTEVTLHARIQEAEHRLFPAVVKAFAAGRLRIEGRRVHWDGPEASPI